MCSWFTLHLFYLWRFSFDSNRLMNASSGIFCFTENKPNYCFGQSSNEILNQVISILSIKLQMTLQYSIHSVSLDCCLHWIWLETDDLYATAVEIDIQKVLLFQREGPINGVTDLLCLNFVKVSFISKF